MIDHGDDLDLRREHYEAHRMISEMRELLDKLHAAWSSGDDDSVHVLIDGEVYEMLQRFEPDDRDR